jgi:hypothetical protein
METLARLARLERRETLEQLVLERPEPQGSRVLQGSLERLGLLQSWMSKPFQEPEHTQSLQEQDLFVSNFGLEEVLVDPEEKVLLALFDAVEVEVDLEGLLMFGWTLLLSAQRRR